MFGKQLLISFAVYVVVNFIAILVSSAMVNNVNCSSKIKLLLFSILFTVAQFVIATFIPYPILVTIFILAAIYAIVLPILSSITRLIRLNGFGAVLYTALIIVFFQTCAKFAIAWGLLKNL